MRFYVCARVVLAAVSLLLGGLLFAGEYRTVALGVDGVAVTNAQANAAWDLSGVLVRFSGASINPVEIARESRGVRYVLSSVPSGATSVWWWAWQPIPYKFGDVVTVSGGGVTGTVQVLQQTAR